jgi:hypothetical protein
MREAITEAGDGSSQGVELGASAFHSGGVGVVLVKRERVPVERVFDAYVAPLTVAGDRFVVLTLRETTEALRVERMRSDFIANVSHELRTPFNGIVGILNVLATTPLSPQQADLIHTVNNSAGHFLKLLNDILDASNVTAQIASLREGCFTDLVRQCVPLESVEEQWDIAGLQQVLRNEWQIDLPLSQLVEQSQAITDEDILQKVIEAAHDVFQKKLDMVGVEQFTPFMRAVLLQNIDSHWREHLSSLDYLRQGIHLRGYAQKQPKQEYKREAFELFGQLLDMVKNEVTRVLMTVQIEKAEQIEEAAQAIEQRADSVTNLTYSAPDETGQAQLFTADAVAQAQVPVVGRNEPCPCGSGKKYKHCHGLLK